MNWWQFLKTNIAHGHTWCISEKWSLNLLHSNSIVLIKSKLNNQGKGYTFKQVTIDI